LRRFPPPQPERPISRFAWGEVPPGDEDCLYLNVWTPRSGDGPWPVLVWSIGGGCTIGWTGSGADDGALLRTRRR
jgi:para-nitrobenzyl esterase